MKHKIPQMVDLSRLLLERDSHAATWRRIAFSAYDGLVLPPVWMHPPAGFLAADRLGRIAHRLGLVGPLASQVLSLFRELDTASAVHSARAIGAQEFKNRALETLQVFGGIERLAPYIVWRNSEIVRGFRRRRQAVIFFSAHFGPLEGVGAGLYQLDMPTLLIKKRTPYGRYPPGYSALSTASGSSSLPSLLKLAYEQLRVGGNVFLTLEGWGTSGQELPFLGRLLRFKRGAVALARLARAPLVPLVARWLPDGRVELEARDPIPFPSDALDKEDYEIALLQDSVHCMEAILKKEPASMRLQQLNHCLRRPSLR